jgi:hypothetical protein
MSINKARLSAQTGFIYAHFLCLISFTNLSYFVHHLSYFVHLCLISFTNLSYFVHQSVLFRSPTLY